MDDDEHIKIQIARTADVAKIRQVTLLCMTSVYTAAPIP